MADRKLRNSSVKAGRGKDLADLLADAQSLIRPVELVTPVRRSDLESIDAPEDLNYSSLSGLLATPGRHGRLR
ncbi:hypothetical protein [Mesorhizobium sp. M9A.F.Ca.ET.002.03.1.2]|uniref:hypothetical protein n=1 Tax=Mesorhizobium sp. M9A.F.Ca.ET.002.03.1.2 TaxID=2493668 RepID=UPI00167A1A8D|nr:hypothetical protein [Mesorhizobium sp. M9A.F.Ca.ET.002.03.1.2]